ncbi:MAG: T9SS type A sorting domain-containing protein [Ignavibacteriaceae bacterium]
MKKLIYIYFLFFSFGIIFAQQASDYFPPDCPRWEYKITVLDSLSNEIDSLSYYRHDLVIDESVFEGRLAKILQTKSGPAETIYFQPYLDSIFLHFSGTDAHEYFKLGYIKILLSALDSVLNMANFNFVEFFTSFEKWYSVYRFNQTINDEYTILQLDTSVTIDNITLPLRLEVLGERLPDESISTPCNDFYCKKFVRKIGVNLLLTLPPPFPPAVVQLFLLEDYIWIAEDYWIVQGVIPPINIDLSELNLNLPSFYIPGLITKLEDFISMTCTSVDDGEAYLPEEITLEQNYPNPFNPSTTIKFSLPSSGNAILKIYNALGEEVAVLIDNELTTGTYEVEWNASGLPSGVYFYYLQAEGFVETKKMLLLK